MNEAGLRQYCREHAGEDLTAEARALLERDPALKCEVEQLAFIKKLISLKQYEQPEPGALARCQAGVQARIAAHQDAGLLMRVREWFEIEGPAASAVYAAAALAIVLLSSAVLYSVGRTGEPPAVVQSSTAELVPVVVADSPAPATNDSPAEMIADIPASQKPVIMFRVDKTGEKPTATDVNYGGQNTVPVNYER